MVVMNSLKRAFILFTLIFAYVSVQAGPGADPADPETWEIIPNSYQYSMTVTAVLVFGMDESRDVQDKIAAFVDGECRGVASPITYVPSEDRYVANLMVYSNRIAGDSVTIYMWDRSEDEIVEVSEKLIFSQNATYGNAYDPYFSLTTYDVPFRVLGGPDAISNAVITLEGYGTQVTDSEGRAEFINVQPLDSIYYSVEAQGYDFYEDSISLVNFEPVEVANLSITKNFLITDEFGNPLEGARITLNGIGSKETDSEGEASFEKLSPSGQSISFSVELEDYDLYQGLILASPPTGEQKIIQLELTTYTVTINVTDAGTPIANASVTLSGYGTLNTNAQGDAVFIEVLPAESIEYSVNADTYDPYASTLAVDNEDVYKSIDITLTAFDVTFSIINGETPVQDARVTLTGYGTKSSDVLGEVVFNNVILENNIQYLITSDQYTNAEGGVSVVDGDVEEKVTLIYRKYDAGFVVDDGTNPVEGAQVSLKIPVKEKENFDDAEIPSYFGMIGNAEWSVDYLGSFFSPYSLKSGTILSNQISGFTFSKTTSDGQISFFARVSSEEDNDFLIFYVDGEEKGRWSGETGWVHVSFALEAGEHVFKWEYKKDATQANGDDCAWIDYIEFPSGTLSNMLNATTNAQGQALIPNIKPAKDLYFKIEAEGYDVLEDSITVIDQDVSSTRSLSLTAMFSVEDEYGNPVQEAIIALEGYGSRLSDEEGKVEFSGVVPADEIAYTVTKDSFDEVQGMLTARPGSSSEEIELYLTTYRLEFRISDDTVAVSNAQVELEGYYSVQANSEGIAIFTDILPSESHEFTVTAKGYDEYTSTFSLVDEDVVKEVDLTLTAFDVKFSVINGAIPVLGVDVLLEEYGTKVTNVFGEVIFENVVLEDNIPYLITSDVYKDYIGNVSVIDGNVEVKVTLENKAFDASIVVTDGTRPVSGAEVSLKYPGPVNNVDIITTGVPEMFSMGGNNSWIVDSDAMFQGEYALKSGEVFDNQSSEISFTANVVTGDISFHSRVSSESEHDYLYFYIDDVETGKWSGEEDWMVNSYPVTTGVHTFKWVFVKDGTVTEGEDCAWIDYIQYPAAEMVSESAVTDQQGVVIFEDLLPHRDSLEFTIEDSRYNNYVDSISVNDHDNLKITELDIDLVFEVSKEFDRAFNIVDSVTLEGYGKKALNSEGVAVFPNVIPVESLDYYITCDEYNTDSGTISGLYSDTIRPELVLTRYDVSFALTYKGNPLTEMDVTLGKHGPLVSDDMGEVTFLQLIPGTYNYKVEHPDYRDATGTITTGNSDTTLRVEVLPVFNVHIVVHSSASSGYIPLENAKVQLSQDNRVLYTTNGQVTFYRLIPDDNLQYTVEADGYESLSGVLHLEDSDLHETMALPLVPVLEATNLITPNSDGKNDYWEIYNVDRYQEFEVQIFSTTGELLYKTKDYGNNKWDGRINGNKLPDGIYYYIITGPTNELKFKGVINLVNN